MADRTNAEQKLCDQLYNAGIITGDKEMIVRRLDFGQPFQVFFGGDIIGKIDYNPKRNIFVNFKAKKLIIPEEKSSKVSLSKSDKMFLTFLTGKKIRL